MPASLGSAVFELTTDNTQFNSAMSESEAVADRSSGVIGDSFGRIIDMAKGFVVAQIALTGIHDIMSAISEAFVGFNSRLEQSKIAWTSMLGSAEDAGAYLYQLQQFANTTPFTFPDVETGARRLIAMGIAAKDVVPDLTAIGDTAAGLGLGAQGIDRLTLAYGQMNAAGRILGQDLRQVQMAGVDTNAIFEQMAEDTGKTTGELKQMQQAGQLTSSIFLKAFNEWAEGASGFANHMELQSHTFQGAMSTIQDSLRTTASMAFSPFFAKMSELANTIANFVQTEDFMQFGAQVNATAGFVLDALGSLGQGFADIFGDILDIVVTVGQAILDAMSYINPFARHSPSIVEQVQAGMAVIKGEYAGLTDIRGSLTTAGQATQDFVSVAKSGLDALQAKLDETKMKALAILGSDVPAAFMAAQTAIGSLKDQLDGLQHAIDQQKGAVSSAADEVTKWKNAIRDQQNAISALQEGLRPFQQAVKDAQEAIQNQQDAISKAKAELDGLNASYKEAQDAFNNFANAPIEGTKQFTDQLFDLQQQTNSAQLKLVDLKLNNGTADQIKAVQDQITELGLKSQQVKLSESLQLDPLKKQIDDLKNPIKELPFQTIIDGMKNSQATMESLQPKITSATDAWHDQQSKLTSLQSTLKEAQKALQDRQDAIQGEQDKLKGLQDSMQKAQDAYDKENKKLADLQGSYKSVNDEISKMQKLLDEASKQADQAEKAAEKAAKGKGGKEQPEAPAIGSRTAGLDLTDAKQRLQEFQDGIANARSAIESKFGPAVAFVNGLLKTMHEGLKSIDDAGHNLEGPVGNLVQGIGDLGKKIGDAIPPEVRDRLNGLVDAAKTFFDLVALGGDPMIALNVALSKLTDDAQGGDKIFQAVGDTFEALGTALHDAFSWLGEHGDTIKFILGEIVTLFAAWKAIQAALFIIGLVQAIIGFVTGLSGMVALVGPMGALIALMGGPVTLIILGIIAVITLLGLAWTNNWGDIQGKTAAVVAWLQGVPGMVGGFFDALGTAVSTMAQDWGNFFDQMGTKVSNFVTSVGEFFSNLGTLINTAITTVTNWIKEHWTDVLLIMLTGPFALVLAYTKVNGQKFFEVFHEFLLSIGNLIAEKWQGFLDTITNFLTMIWQTLVNLNDAMYNSEMAALSAISDLLTKWWNIFLSIVKDLLTQMWNFIIQKWADITAAIQTAVDFIRDNIVTPFKDWLTETWNLLWNGLSMKTTEIWEEIKATAKGGVNAVIGFIDAMVEAWNSIHLKIPSHTFNFPFGVSFTTPEVDIEPPHIQPPQFLDYGGTVMGAYRGQPVLVVAHAGEKYLGANGEKEDRSQSSGSGETHYHFEAKVTNQPVAMDERRLVSMMDSMRLLHRTRVGVR